MDTGVCGRILLSEFASRIKSSGCRTDRPVASWSLFRSVLAEGRMHLIITLLVFVGLAAIIVWIADWTSGGEGRATALDVLNRRLARGEISRAEYDRKRKLLARW